MSRPDLSTTPPVHARMSSPPRTGSKPRTRSNERGSRHTLRNRTFRPRKLDMESDDSKKDDISEQQGVNELGRERNADDRERSSKKQKHVSVQETKEGS